MAIWSPLGVAGILSSMGLGFIMVTEVMLPVTIVFMLFSVGILLRGAKKRRGYKPFFLGFCGALMIIFGNFLFKSDVVTLAGIIQLVVASIWHASPRGWLGRLRGQGKSIVPCGADKEKDNHESGIEN